jgi:hypothetical protein
MTRRTHMSSSFSHPSHVAGSKRRCGGAPTPRSRGRTGSCAGLEGCCARGRPRRRARQQGRSTGKGPRQGGTTCASARPAGGEEDSTACACARPVALGAISVVDYSWVLGAVLGWDPGWRWRRRRDPRRMRRWWQAVGRTLAVGSRGWRSRVLGGVEQGGN